ncbi:MAG: slipin family protein [Candidatus Thiodiazotropha weberae]|nr:slipin family protein [Candidatus Thiodiazotropha lotti]MCW4213995.1 slipin family protein [Candidatus Thiodiazotropha lotti]
MFATKRIVVAQHERGFLFRDSQLIEVLEPGVYRHFDPFNRVKIELHDLGQAVCSNKNAEFLLQDAKDLLGSYLELVDLTEHQIGVVYRDNKFIDLLAPGERRIYWKQPYSLRVDRVDLHNDQPVSRHLVETVFRSRGGVVARELQPYIHTAEVSDHYLGLLLVDGELRETLKPGFHAFWAVKRHVKVEQLDTRVQSMEVQGQEILSRDKVSLRLNLGAQFQIVDPVMARSKLQQPLDWIYRELQFGLRQAVGSRDLDKLLEDKERVDREVFDKVAVRAAENGFELRSVGLKDVILPGEMKEILNQVVQAEKAAQANVIKRREETAATRSLLNTAKLMDENPTLLRLKELETLEKVTDKVDRLTVFGGLDGVLKDTVKINV